MSQDQPCRDLRTSLLRHIRLLAVLWTFCVGVSCVWNVNHQGENSLAMAQNAARITADNDHLYRRWVGARGGVYVRSTSLTPPNPFLAAADREVTTTSGQRLTLVNPAYLARQVHEMADETSGPKRHLTSLRPLRPANAPDAWEAEALRSFERGTTESTSLEAQAGSGRLRLMRPFLTKQHCLKCHAAQGFKEGDVRGGVSIAVPMEGFRVIEKHYVASLSFAHLCLWLLGLAGLRWSRDRLDGTVRSRERAEDALRRLNVELERRVALRTTELEARAGQLQKLAAEVTLAEERERRRLAQVLHDHLQQLLVATKIHAGLLEKKLTTTDPARQEAREIDKLIQEAIDASRSLTAELSPPVLYDAGLPQALRWLGRWMLEKHRLQVEVNVNEDCEPGRLEMKVLLFQAVRELLFNVAKHSGSLEARLDVSQIDDRIVISVTDRGGGFSSSEQATRSGGGFGLFSVRERLELLGGSITVRSSPGQGASVTLTAPLLPASDPSAVGESHPGSRSAESGAGAAVAGPRIRVLLVDDHRTVREGLAAILGQQPEIELVGQATDGVEAVELACALRPDVVIMDITLPRLNGIEATRRITATLPEVRVIGLSMHQQEDVARCMKEAGAQAYLCKDGPTEALLEAIGTVFRTVARSSRSNDASGPERAER